jgi:hypothetical protein
MELNTYDQAPDTSPLLAYRSLRFCSLKIAHTAEGDGPEIDCKLLKELVGNRGFEPPPPGLEPDVLGH